MSSKAGSVKRFPEPKTKLNVSPTSKGKAASTSAAITNEVKAQVRSHVRDGLAHWDYGKDRQHSSVTFPLDEDYKLLALMMDRLYTHHFRNAFALDAVPDDEAPKNLSRHALQDVPERFQESAKER